MRILLVDNSKAHAAFFTPKLEQLLREYATVVVCKTREAAAELLLTRYDGIVLSGSSLNVSESLTTSAISKDLMMLLRFPHIPKLGVCFGMQLMAVAYGGSVARLPEIREGECDVLAEASSDSLMACSRTSAFFSHQDVVVEAPPGFVVDAHSDGLIASFHSSSLKCYGTQFHPECSQTDHARGVVKTFLRRTESALINIGGTLLTEYEYNTVAMRMGRESIVSLTKKMNLERHVILQVWAEFRSFYRIPAMLV